MDFVGDIYRPPSEANSILLQITVGCSHNACSFCGMYREKRFAIKSLPTIFADIDEAAKRFPSIPRLFLCDGDAMVLHSTKLLPILERIRERLPWVRRISAYADSRSICQKSADELKSVRALGLSLLYHGVESGSDTVLQRINKGSTASDAVRAANLLRDASIGHSVMFLLGLGGQELSTEHAIASGKLLSEMNPTFASALTLTLVPGTPLAEAAKNGKFILPNAFEMLEELRLILANTEVTRCQFAANHASNYLPIKGRLPEDRNNLVASIESILKSKDSRQLTPEWMRGL
jgi:radical SAM superfamily enzyme YgiQ (UPF0313 family)